MKKRIKWTVILLLFLVYATLLLCCTNTEEPNVYNNDNLSDTLESVLEITAPKPEQDTPPMEIREYSYELYVSGSDEEVAQVITSTKMLKEFLDNKNIKKNIAVSAVPNYLGELINNYGDRFFKDNNLIICISKRKDLVLYGDISRVYGNNEHIEILFEEVKNKGLYKELSNSTSLSSSVVFEVSKDICNENTAVSFMLREKKEDPLTFPNEWVAENIDREYHNSGEKYFPDEFYNIAIMGFLRDAEELDDYVNNVFWKEYDGMTPPLYSIMSYFGVTRDEFYKINDELKKYNDKFGDIYTVYPYASSEVKTMELFTDNEYDARKNLCKSNLVYCDGVFYDFLESDIIEFREESLTYNEWCWRFIDDFELLQDFLVYADSKAFRRFAYDHYEGGRFDIPRDEEGNLINYEEIQKKYAVIQQSMESVDWNNAPYGESGEIAQYYCQRLAHAGFHEVFRDEKEIKELFEQKYADKKSAEELDYLPVAYHLIRDLGIKDRREEFYLANEANKAYKPEQIRFWFLDERQFELLFGDYAEETVKKELKLPMIFYFEGKLYNLSDLMNEESALLDKMGEGSEFKDYLADLQSTRYYRENIEKYSEYVDGWLEKYYGIRE